MTQDEMIELAKQAGFSIADGIVTGGTTDIQRLAELVTRAIEKRTWVGLTHEELCKIVGVSTNDSDWNVFKVQEWLRKVEARLKEKNT